MNAPLRERAAAAKNTERPSRPAQSAPATPVLAEYPDPVTPDPEKVPIHVAWARVMRDVRSIGKPDRFDEGGTRFQYRGADTVSNAVGPAVRRHGVIITPTLIVPSYRDTTSLKGRPMRECTVVVTYTITGPAGDTITTAGAGESLDIGDKATSKALTIAYRNMIVEALAVASGLDPEAEAIERGQRVITPVEYAAEVIDPRTTISRIKQIRAELREAGRLAAVVDSPLGEVALGRLIDHVGTERSVGRDPFPEPQPEPTEPAESAEPGKEQQP